MLSPGRGGYVEVPHETKAPETEHGKRVIFLRRRILIHLGPSAQYAAGQGVGRLAADTSDVPQRLYYSKAHYPAEIT